MSKSVSKKSYTTKQWVYLGALVIVGLWVLTPFLSSVTTALLSDSFMAIYSKPIGAGEFGDQFGSLNALFSGLAFLGLTTAIFLQRKEIGLQREDLALQRKEIKDQTKVFKLQQEEMKVQNESLKIQQESIELQNFETRFFNMLEMNRKLLPDGFSRVINANIKRLDTILPEPETRMINYSEFVKLRYSEELEGYMNSIYKALFMISKSRTSESAEYYANLYLSFFNTNEHRYILLRSMSRTHRDSFFPLFDKLNIIDSILITTCYGDKRYQFLIEETLSYLKTKAN